MRAASPLTSCCRMLQSLDPNSSVCLLTTLQLICRRGSKSDEPFCFSHRNCPNLRRSRTFRAFSSPGAATAIRFGGYIACRLLDSLPLLSAPVRKTFVLLELECLEIPLVKSLQSNPSG